MPRSFGKIRMNTFERDGKVYPWDEERVVRWTTDVPIDDFKTDGPEVNEDLLREIEGKAMKHFELKLRREFQKWRIKSVERSITFDNYYGIVHRHDDLTLENYIRVEWFKANPDELLTPMRSGNWFRPARKDAPVFPDFPYISEVNFIYTATFVNGPEAEDLGATFINGLGDDSK